MWENVHDVIVPNIWLGVLWEYYFRLAQHPEQPTLEFDQLQKSEQINLLVNRVAGQLPLSKNQYLHSIHSSHSVSST